MVEIRVLLYIVIGGQFWYISCFVFRVSIFLLWKDSIMTFQPNDRTVVEDAVKRMLQLKKEGLGPVAACGFVGLEFDLNAEMAEDVLQGVSAVLQEEHRAKFHYRK